MLLLPPSPTLQCLFHSVTFFLSSISSSSSSLFVSLYRFIFGCRKSENVDLMQSPATPPSPPPFGWVAVAEDVVVVIAAVVDAAIKNERAKCGLPLGPKPKEQINIRVSSGKQINNDSCRRQQRGTSGKPNRLRAASTVNNHFSFRPPPTHPSLVFSSRLTFLPF